MTTIKNNQLSLFDNQLVQSSAVSTLQLWAKGYPLALFFVNCRSSRKYTLLEQMWLWRRNCLRI